MSKISNTMKKFAAIGVAGVLTMYGAQAVTVAGYNNLTQHTYESKMVSLYNNIWKNIDKQDVSSELQDYKKIASEVPNELKMGLFLPERTEKKIEVSGQLPTAESVEKSAIALNEKTKIKFR